MAVISMIDQAPELALFSPGRVKGQPNHDMQTTEVTVYNIIRFLWGDCPYNYVTTF